MQTFLPYPNFAASAAALDDSRLGNQAYRECKSLVNGGWKNHPASKMWRGYEYALCAYALACLYELRDNRGRHYQHHIDWFMERQASFPDTGLPPWLGDFDFHMIHRAILLGKAWEKLVTACGSDFRAHAMCGGRSEPASNVEKKAWKQWMWYDYYDWQETPANRDEDGKWSYIWPEVTA